MTGRLIRRTEALGRRGEDAAAVYLRREGMRILARNWTCGDGELDIVAGHGDILVVAEVKTRSSGRFGSPLKAVDAAKRRRLRRLARHWAAGRTEVFARTRVDVVSVLAGADGRCYVKHHRGVG